MNNVIRIATRRSPLALWQANYVRQKIIHYYPSCRVKLVPIETRGDIMLDSPLAKIGGKGLFVKELELALLENHADIAVHSMKDVPMQFPPQLGLVAICQRDIPYDAFVSNRYSHLEQLPLGAIVGTSSLRRQCQIKALRNDLKIHNLRGNVGSRLSKLDNNHYDAIILATAGLNRLNMSARVTQILPENICLPAVGQGAIGIECRLDDHVSINVLAHLNDPQTALCIQAERAMNNHLNGGCQVPIAGYAQINGKQLHLKGLVGMPDGSQIIYDEQQGAINQAEQIGINVADKLLSQGADRILRQLYDPVLHL